MIKTTLIIKWLCQSALASINSFSNIPYYCYETQKLVEQLGRTTNLHLLWTPGHRKIEGNEIADCLAKRAALNTRLLTTPSKLSFKCIISNLKETIQRKREVIWNRSITGQLTKKFFPATYLTEVLNKRSMTHQTVQILTGHCRLNSYLFRFKILDSPTCNCSLSIETIHHFLFECKIFHDLRLSFKRIVERRNISWPPPYEKLVQDDQLWSVMMYFVKSTNRLKIPYWLWLYFVNNL